MIDGSLNLDSEYIQVNIQLIPRSKAEVEAPHVASLQTAEQKRAPGQL